MRRDTTLTACCTTTTTSRAAEPTTRAAAPIQCPQDFEWKRLLGKSAGRYEEDASWT